MLELFLYRLIWFLLSPFLGLIIYFRRRKNKEDANSAIQRFAKAQIVKKNGKRIWIHAASVGESMISINIARHLKTILPQLQFVFTCQTQTAAQIIAKNMGKNDIFQFLPFDHPSIATRFVDNIDCDLAVFIEGEIWPNLLMALRKSGIKSALINSRMTLKSIASWKKVKSLSNLVFGGFDFIHAANQNSFDFLSQFSNNVSNKIANLKFAAPALEYNDAEVNSIKNAIGNRPVWLCASSHEGEEEIILKSHELLRQKNSDYLLIIAPRHLNRTQAIQELCTDLKMQSVAKSSGALPSANDNIFIWDVLGQMGPFFKLGEMAFVAGSLLPNIGGHNPIEPAQLNCAILSGPYFHNFTDIYADLVANNGAIITNDDEISISDAILKMQSSDTNLSIQKANALAIVERSGDLLKEIDQNLLALLKE